MMCCDRGRYSRRTKPDRLEKCGFAKGLSRLQPRSETLEILHLHGTQRDECPQVFVADKNSLATVRKQFRFQSMGCCGLESGDAVSAIPFRNLTNCAAQPFRWRQQEELEMSPKRSKSSIDRKMPMVHPNAAAIDIGATMHMAAVRADRAPEPVRSFATFTADLHRLVDWFTECGVETVVMESTSVYWIPIFELLDARGFTVFLVNARDAKHVPGRKTDVSDAQWLQRLHSFGLLRASFRPKGQIAELRSYAGQGERIAGAVIVWKIILDKAETYASRGQF